jgi:hypothetical protein
VELTFSDNFITGQERVSSQKARVPEVYAALAMNRRSRRKAVETAVCGGAHTESFQQPRR